MVRALIFDFDGTIANSMPAIIEMINSLANEFRYKKLRKEDMQQKGRSLNSILAHDLGVSKFRLPFFLLKLRRKMKEAIVNVRPVPNMKEVTISLYKKNYSLYILTYNRVDNVQRFLENNEMEVFDKIYSSSPYLLGKARTIKKLLKEQKITPEEVLYIGDDINDIKAAKKAGVKIVAATWGANSKRGLENHFPEFIIDAPRELLSLIG